MRRMFALRYGSEWGIRGPSVGDITILSAAEQCNFQETNPGMNGCPVFCFSCNISRLICLICLFRSGYGSTYRRDLFVQSVSNSFQTFHLSDYNFSMNVKCHLHKLFSMINQFIFLILYLYSHVSNGCLDYFPHKIKISENNTPIKLYS